MDKFNLSSALTKRMSKISCVYRIHNTISDKSYIGSTNDLRRRIKKHRDELTANNHKNQHLQRSYNKYGRESFDVYVEELVEVENLIEKERFYIDKYNSKEFGYNMCDPQAFPKLSEESKIKLKEHTTSTRKCVIAVNKDSGEFFKEFASVSEASEFFNTSTSNISRVCLGKVNYIKGCVFIYKNEYDPNKNYSYIKPKKIVSDETKKKMISSNAKSIPIYKYNLDKVLIEEYPSRLNCEKNERFKNEEIRYIITKYKSFKYNNNIYSYYNPNEIIDSLDLETIYVKL